MVPLYFQRRGFLHHGRDILPSYRIHREPPQKVHRMSIRAVSLASVVLDQLSKFWIVRSCKLGQSVTVLKEYFYITYIQNPGAAFGFMADMPAYVRIPFFIIITLGAGLIVYAYQRFMP